MNVANQALGRAFLFLVFLFEEPRKPRTISTSETVVADDAPGNTIKSKGFQAWIPQ